MFHLDVSAYITDVFVKNNNEDVSECHAYVHIAWLFDDKSKFLHFGVLKKVTFLKLPNALVYLTLE